MDFAECPEDFFVRKVMDVVGKGLLLMVISGIVISIFQV